MTTNAQPTALEPRRMPAGPPGNPVLGNLRALQRDPLGFMLDANRRYGDIVRYRIATLRAFLVIHPDYVKRVLQDNHTNYTKDVLDYRVLKWIVEEGVLLSDGPLWLRQRRLMQPAFHRQRIAAMGAMMARCASDLADVWDGQATRDSPLAIEDEMLSVALRVVGLALFTQELSGAVATVGRTFSSLSHDLIARFRSAMFLPPVLPTRRDRAFRANRQELDRVVNGIIAERRASGDDKPDLLGMLLAARDEETGDGMNDEQLRAEVKTLLLAGHETTANALTWTWYLLSQHPEAEAKLHAELDMVLAGRTPTIEDLPRLAYTRMVIDETLRLYPPAWIVARRATAADTFGPYALPAGANVVISTYVTHRHPQFWEEPARFDPERFSPERAEKRHRYAYFPFGGGPRQCIGNTFALMEAQLILATLAQRYRLRLVPGHPVEPQALITLRPKHGMAMRAERRA